MRHLRPIREQGQVSGTSPFSEYNSPGPLPAQKIFFTLAANVVLVCTRRRHSKHIKVVTTLGCHSCSEGTPSFRPTSLPPSRQSTAPKVCLKFIKNGCNGGWNTQTFWSLDTNRLLSRAVTFGEAYFRSHNSRGSILESTHIFMSIIWTRGYPLKRITPSNVLYGTYGPWHPPGM